MDQFSQNNRQNQNFGCHPEIMLEINCMSDLVGRQVIVGFDGACGDLHFRVTPPSET